jgi:hypothetical protein
MATKGKAKAFMFVGFGIDALEVARSGFAC